MAIVCLLKDKVDDFRKALKEKDIKIQDLLNMTTEERTKVFREYTADDATATKINTQFEERLVLKNRMLGIQNLFSKLGEIGKYSEAGKIKVQDALSEYRAAQQERIFNPKENQTFLNDLADKLAGTHISKEVAKTIVDLSSKANDLKDKNPNISGFSDEYLKAKLELDNYVNSQKPYGVTSSIAKNLATIGRNNLLMNPATPIKATIGQVVNSAMDFVSRRLGNLTLRGDNVDLVKEANTEAWDTFKKTGLNTTAMTSLDDTHILNKGENFKVPNTEYAKGVIGAIETGVRKTAEISNKIAIDWEHNYTFTKFYQKAFFDMANVFSTNLEKNGAGDASEIFKDAARIEPKTDIGAMVRQQAQEQAARVTSTNETFVSRLALGAKQALNKVIPGFPMGDLIIPMAKIPANIIANGIDNAGAGIPKGLVDFFQGREKMQSDNLAIKYEGAAQFASGIQRLGRIAGTISLAALLTSSLTKDDFKQDKYGDNFVRIGGVWINTEYISAISPALAGMMTAKQKGGNAISQTGEYVSGALQGLKKAPGINEVNDLVTNITNSDYVKGIQKYASDFFSSRGVPMFLNNLMKGEGVRGLFFGASGLPTDKELGKLGVAGAGSDWSTSTAKDMVQFKAKVGDANFQKANDLYNKAYSKWYDGLATNKKFQALPDNLKKNVITNKKASIKNQVFQKYGFKYVAPKKPVTPKF